jgi:hypothetical protein
MFREIPNAPDVELRHQRLNPVVEAEWHARVTRLEQLVCELLNENQRLRMCIASAEPSEGGVKEKSDVSSI